MSQPWRNYLNWSPLSILGIALVILLSSQVLAVNLLLNQPWTGLNLEPDPVSGFVKVVSVDKGSPAEGRVREGTILTQVSDGADKISLSSKLYVFPFLHVDYDHYKITLDQQSSIYKILIEDKFLFFRTLDNNAFWLYPKKNTPLLSLPIYFWLFSLVFLLTVLVDLFVWIYRRQVPITFVLLVSCLACFYFHLIGSINFSKDFFFNGEISYCLSIIEVICLNIYIPLFFFTLSNFPNKLLNRYWSVLYYFAFSFYSINFYFQWIKLPDNYLVFQAIVPFSIGVAVCIFQIRKSIFKPLEKIATSIIFGCMLIPYIPIIALHILPISFGKEPMMSHQLVQLFGATSFIGLAVGILRFRLFQIEYWWFKSWFWLVASLLLILIDIILINFLQTSSVYALGISVFIVGFIYFPLRQWALAKFLPLDTLTIQDFLAKFSQELIQAGSSVQELEEVWKKILKARFNPQDFSNRLETITHPQLAEHGLSLQIPSLQSSGSYYLTGKQLAARLFNKADIAASSSLLDVVKITQAATELREHSMLAERDYWLQEINATVGQDLLKLLNESNDEPERMSSLDVLETLRQTIYLSTKANSLSLEENLKNWRKEIEERLASSQTILSWQVTDNLRNCYLSALQIIELSQFLREATTNALKHAQPRSLVLSFDRINESLYIRVEHDGNFSAPEHWHAGNGLKNLRTRIAALQGALEFFIDSDRAYLCLYAQFPLLAKLPHD